MKASAATPEHAFESQNGRAQPMLTRDDTAAYLAVSKRTLDRLVQAGELTAYRIGGHRRFRMQDIDSFIASRKE